MQDVAERVKNAESLDEIEALLFMQIVVDY
jgi:hypothetical protein